MVNIISNGQDMGEVRTGLNEDNTSIDARVTTLESQNTGDQVSETVPFNNAGTGMTATQVRAAIIEAYEAAGGGSGLPVVKTAVESLDPFPFINKLQPAFGGGTGQSNIECMEDFVTGGSKPMYKNDNVLCWSTDGSLTATPTYDFRICDPDGALYDDFFYQSHTPAGPNYHIYGRGNAPYSGYPRGGRGNATLGAAQRLQEQRGGKVYFWNIAWSGQDSSKWKPGVGAVAQMIDAQMPAMIARLRVLEPDWFAGTDPIPWNFLILSQAEGDVLITPPAQWATNWEEWLDYCSTFTVDGSLNYVNTKWFDRRNTRITMMQRAQRATYNPTWNGQEILQRRRRNINIVSSAGRLVIDGIHYPGGVQTEFGRDIAGDWIARGHSPDDIGIEIMGHSDFKKMTIGRFQSAGVTADVTLNPGTGKFEYFGFSQAVTVSKRDLDNVPVDLSHLKDGDWVGFQLATDNSLGWGLAMSVAGGGVVEYDTHWVVYLNFLGTLDNSASLGSSDTRYFDLYTSSNVNLPVIQGVAKLATQQNVAAGSVTDPGTGKFAINIGAGGAHTGLVMSKTGSDYTPIELSMLRVGYWIEFVKANDPFKKYRLNITIQSFGSYGDKGTWWHFQTSLNNQTAGFTLTVGDEYIVRTNCPIAIPATAKLEAPYKQLNIGIANDAPNSAVSAKAFDLTGLVAHFESRASSKVRMMFRLFLNEFTKVFKAISSHSMKLLVKGSSFKLTMLNLTTGAEVDAIDVVAKAGANPVVSVNAIAGGIYAIANGTAEASIGTTAVMITVCWNADMASNDVVPSHAAGTLQVKTPGVYEIEAILTFTGTPSKIFTFGINNTFFMARRFTRTDTDTKPIQVQFKGYKACVLDELIQVYVTGPDAGNSLTFTEAQLTAKRLFT